MGSSQVQAAGLHDAALFNVDGRDACLKGSFSRLATENEDVRSSGDDDPWSEGHVGLFGTCAQPRKKMPTFTGYHEALARSGQQPGADDLVALTLRTGEHGVKAMALLDAGNTSRYGNPEITTVNIGVRKNPAILISGHDLTDLEQLLEQTKGTGVDVYTHSEMLPAHYYPAFKKYGNFAGNYGGSWWRQVGEFETFHGPILFTTNCIVPPRSEEVRQRIFTTGSAGFPGCPHIVADKEGKKDFSAVIEMAKKLPAPEEIETGTIVGGFAHNQVLSLADKVVDAVIRRDQKVLRYGRLRWTHEVKGILHRVCR